VILGHFVESASFTPAFGGISINLLLPKIRSSPASRMPQHVKPFANISSQVNALLTYQSEYQWFFLDKIK